MRVGNSELADRVRGVIAERVTDTSVTVRNKRAIMHIKDMDNVTTREEIVEALTKECGGEADHEVTSLRPAYQNTQAATIKTSEACANLLEKTGKVRIGLVRCRIKRREETPRCSRCWEEGHMIKNCKGQDFMKRCRKCGEEGHYAVRCKKEVPACIVCKVEGHRTYAVGCPKRRASGEGKEKAAEEKKGERAPEERNREVGGAHRIFSDSPAGNKGDTGRG